MVGLSHVDDRKLSVAATAEALGVSRSVVYKLVQGGALPALRIGRRIVVSARDLAAFMEGARI